ncbi:DNA recombination protein RmuC [Psychromonas sp. psych-6C06]|uniref:DNA recombination protein RmuC n=1 Tax=Psychromonas sp. psych-6C06 TaxID=2058089 RepID=UPI000C32B8A7|nr:DNA recombination protein RmuC [Psychromonas sp. psych-6C06]PKF60776.1 DNA recombination protein RmuC [Psychromonas sp. psych-6C06]
MNLTPIELSILATLVVLLLLSCALYLRTKSQLTTTQLLHQQESNFQQSLLESRSTELEASKLLVESLQSQQNKLTARLRESEVRLQAGEQRLRDQLASEEKLSAQFELLSQRIFNDKSAQFKALNEDNLTQLLAPFKVQLEGFKQQVNACYMSESKERYNLQAEINKLAQLNQMMQQETNNLTNALKGDNKQMGNWGEVVLQRILENSGLREGHEYETQGHYKSESGQRFLPDVVVHLPQNKNIIIDSKVSLVAYERYFNSDDVNEQQEALKAHALSVRQHIKGLAKKDYQNLIGANSLDYVLLFVAVEPAFIVAIEHDPELVKLALDNNILLASPTNLMIALRTIENLWRFDLQEKNGRLISNQASKLYDKLRLFSNNLLEVGTQLGKAQDSYDHALKQFSEGRGNLIAQAESLKTMGVTVNKPLPEQLVELAKGEK